MQKAQTKNKQNYTNKHFTGLESQIAHDSRKIRYA